MNRHHDDDSVLDAADRPGKHASSNGEPAPASARDLTPDAAASAIATLRDSIGSVFIGHEAVIDRLITCLIARGHALIEDVPGVGKTVLATALARSIDCRFTRIQLTPDMLPADVLGVSVFDQHRGVFDFKPGPIFTNILLADEINRTTPRTQSALLESMNEGTVSVEGRTHALDAPFVVIATQNPYEFEGTYPLPENQLDRFLMRITMGYPEPEDEARVLELRPSETTLDRLEPVMHADDVVGIQQLAAGVAMERSLTEYVVELARRTREHPELRVGLSTRGALALTHAARASAVMAGRDYCTPEDIIDNAIAVAAHRVVSASYASTRETGAAGPIIEQLLRTVPSPA
jgi:MoxR-like ATPase